MDNTLEKTAMDPKTRKYLGSGISAALVSAGLGTVLSRIASEKKRQKELDVLKNRNIITVDVDIPNFLKDLPTPAQFAESVSNKPSLAQNTEIGQDDIASLKKEILSRNKNKIDFFRKAASQASKSENDDKDDGKKGEEDKKNDTPEDKTTRLRGEDGRFVSATSPIAVADVEKSAGVLKSLIRGIGALSKPITDPVVEFGGKVKDGLVESPKLVAGGVASVVLATMIAKRINKLRAESAEDKLKYQRDKYVDKLNGYEKEAKYNSESDEGGLGRYVGLATGTAFLAPFTLSALVSYQIMKNRAKQQEDEKKSMRGFATPPVVVYRTHGDAEKSAAYRSPGQRIGDAIKYVGNKISTGVGKIVDHTGLGVDNGVERAIDIFGREENKDRIADFAKGVMSGNDSGGLFKMLNAGDMLYAPVFASNSFKKKLLSNSKFQDMIIKMMKDTRYADSFGKVRDAAISRGVGKLVGDNNEANRLLSGLVLSSGAWEPGVRHYMDNMARRYN